MRPVVLHLVPSLGQGGAERVLASLAGGQAAGDHHVLTLLGEEPFFQIPESHFATLGMTRQSLVSPAAIVGLRRHVRRLRPDLIHAWLYHGNFFSLFAAGMGVPILWSIHNTTLSALTSKRGTRTVNRMCAPLSHVIPRRIVYCSPSARLVHEQLGYARSRGLVIKNGIDLTAFRFDPQTRQRMRESLGLAPDMFAVGCVARFDPQKNHPLIIEAFSQSLAAGAAKLVLAGTGCTPDNDELHHWLDAAGVSEAALLLGERRDVAGLMSAFDALIIGSTYGEALPVVAIEAAAAGLPVVATDVGDVALFVQDPAELVPPGDPKRLAQALMHARRRAFSPEAVGRRAQPCNDDLHEYSLDHMAAKYLNLYKFISSPSSYTGTIR